MKKILLAALLITIVFTSCSDLRSELKDMRALQEKIQTQFNFKEVNIKIVNGKAMDVSIINSPYNDSSDDVKQRLTDAIGSVSSPYIHAAKLSEGTVSFVHSNNVGIINSSNYQSFPMHLSN